MSTGGAKLVVVNASLGFGPTTTGETVHTVQAILHAENSRRDPNGSWVITQFLLGMI
jgi:hypothetical protein